MHESIPPLVRRSGLLTRDVGAETLIYGADQQMLHLLNPSARAIWESCDGAQSIEAIAQQLRDRFAVPDDYDLQADIQATLRELLAKGLIEPSISVESAPTGS